MQLSSDDIDLLQEMRLLATNIIELNDRTNDEFKIGFHADPSMQQLHLHVISIDFNSSCLKTKRHWNSFNTDFFIPHHELVDRLKQTGKIVKLPETKIKELLSISLQCNQCHYKPKNMPDLKQHLLSHCKIK